MTHDAKTALQRYLDGMLADDERIDFERRLDSEPALRVELARLRAASETLVGLEEHQLSPSVRERIVAAQRVTSYRQLTGNTLRRRIASAAAALIIAVAAGFFAGRLSVRGEMSATEEPVGAVQSGLVSGIPRDPVADAALRTRANAEAPVFLLLLHGPPDEHLDGLAEEMHEWRTAATAAWTNSLAATDRLVASGELTDDGTGLRAGDEGGSVELVDPAGWYQEDWMAPTQFFVLRANDLAEAYRLAGVLPHTSLGGRISVRQVSSRP